MPKLPTRGYLYTWNFFDGFLGLPRRKIRLSDVKPSLLHVAYLGGGHRWDGDTPAGAILCLILQASSRCNQSPDDYSTCFEHYDLAALRQISGGKVEEISGLKAARWEVQMDCRGWSNNRIDKTIEAILLWHTAEITRILKKNDTIYE